MRGSSFFSIGRGKKKTILPVLLGSYVWFEGLWEFTATFIYAYFHCWHNCLWLWRNNSKWMVLIVCSSVQLVLHFTLLQPRKLGFLT